MDGIAKRGREAASFLDEVRRWEWLSLPAWPKAFVGVRDVLAPQSTAENALDVCTGRERSLKANRPVLLLWPW
jgi:hypothetical protein